MQKEVLTPQRSGSFIPSLRWSSQNLWRRSSQNIHFNPVSSRTRRGTKNSSRRIRRTLFSIPTSRWLNGDVEDAKSNFWTMTGEFVYRHHVDPPSQTVHAERRITSYTDEAHRRRRHQHNTCVIRCIVGWKKIQMHGQASQDSFR